MSEVVSVLWVDDENQTEEIKSLCSESLNIEWLHPIDLETKLKQYRSINSTPDLFLIDFYLGLKPDNSGEKYLYQGLTPNALIRDKYPEHPIYLVTENVNENGDAKLHSWSQAAECIFDNIFTLQRIQREGKEILYYDALYYRKIRKDTKRGDIDALLDLLKAPASIKEEIKLILPDDLKSGLMTEQSSKPKGNTILFARWIREVLIQNPGYLYNRLYTATMLGVTIKAFEKISKDFEEARYMGIFSRTSDEMWWVSVINDIIFRNDNAQEVKSSNIWEVYTTIFSVPEEERSRCIVCDEPFPETIGKNSDNPKEMGPVHFRCSKPDLYKKRILYFDGSRVFSRDKI